VHRPGVWLATGQDVSDPSWVPLLRPTPSHQDYTSTHATFGGAAAAVLKYFNGGSDRIDASFSSNATLDAKGVLTRRFTSIREASEENAKSRIYGGIHFGFAGDEGIKLGRRIAEETLRFFDDAWDQF
jgi:hypothetical protein